MSDRETGGLFKTGTQQRCCALKAVKAHASITAGQAVTVVTQRYRNDEANAIEAVYRFPIPYDAVVTRFTATIGETAVEGRLCEREEARRRYEEAKRAGDSAMLLERNAADVFDISVGAVAPGEEAAVTMEYWQELKAVDGRCRYAFPTALAPRYLPASHGNKARDISPNIGEAEYLLEFTADIDMGDLCLGVTSPSHGVDVKQGEGGLLRVSLSTPALMDGDLLLDVALRDPAADVCIAEEGPDGNFLWLKFRTGEDEPGEASNKEYVFLLDASGSMLGGKLEQAKRALSLCLRNLMQGDRFFLVAFGSEFRCFSAESVEYSQAALDGADAWLNGVGDLGGTEIYAPLLHACCLQGCGLRREILLFTDGQVGNEEQVLSLVRSNSGRARLFPFGIDTAVNRHFIDGLAQAGGGLPEYIYPGERIDDKIVRQFARIGSTAVLDVAMEGVGPAGAVNLRNAAASTAFPQALYFGEEYSLCFNLGFRPLPDRVAVSGLAGRTPFRKEIALGRKIGWQGLSKRWARETIAALEERIDMETGSEKLNRTGEVIETSLQYGVISRYTSYLAYISRKDKLSGKVTTSVVPSALPSLWEDEPEMCYAARLVDSTRYGAAQPAPIMSAFAAPGASPSFMRHIAPPAGRQRITAQRAADPLSLAAMEAAMLQKADGSIWNEHGAERATAYFVIGMLLGGEFQPFRNQIIKAVQYLLEHWPCNDGLWTAIAVNLAARAGFGDLGECMACVQGCTMDFSPVAKSLYGEAEAGRWQNVFYEIHEADKRRIAVWLLEGLAH